VPLQRPSRNFVVVQLRAGLVVASLLFCAHAAVAECSKRELRAKSTATISLEPDVRLRPAFYLRQSWTLLFFRPEDVVGVIEAEAADDSSNHERIAAVVERIRRDLPLKEDTDLYKYGVHDLEFAAQLSYRVAKLLDAGRAAVDFWPTHESGSRTDELNDKFDPVTIKRVQWETRGGNGRRFCNIDGIEFFSVVDEIYD